MSAFISCAWGPTPTRCSLRSPGLRPVAAKRPPDPQSQLLAIRLLLRSGGPEARSSRGGGAPRERAGVGPRPQTKMLTLGR